MRIVKNKDVNFDEPFPLSAQSDSVLPLSIEQLATLCEGFVIQRPQNIHGILNSIALILPLLNAISNVVFFIKDREARYLIANLTLAKRCGFKTINPLLGKTSEAIFPSKLGSGYTQQDRLVLQQGIKIQDQLEMHLYNGRETGWCLTQKLPLYDINGTIIGMAGISYDLQEAKANHPAYRQLVAVDSYIREHYSRTISLNELTSLTGFSVAQLERYCKRIFRLTPRQMIHKVRLENATKLLATTMPITDIALHCGYTDHSAFSRQFKALTGSTPRHFRATLNVEC